MSFWIALRQATRSTWRAPAVSIAVVLTIAAGLGSNVVVQAFVRGLMSNDPSSIAPEAMDVVGLLQLAGTLLFALTCVNITLLLLFRTTARSRDAALRVAIGAGRRQLAWQLLAESLVLAVAGTAVALLLGLWTSQLLPVLLWAPYAEQLYFDLYATDLLLAAALGVSVVSLCGLVPMIDVKDRQPAKILQRESAGPSRRAQRLRTMLLIVQTAGTCAFIITAQLLLNRFDAVLETSLGKVAANPILVTVGVEPKGSKSQVLEKASEYFAAVERAAKQVPGVAGTTWIWRPPGSAPITRRFSMEPANLPLDDVLLDVHVVRANGPAGGNLTLHAGRSFTATDAAPGCRVALLSQHAAGSLFGGQPLGRAVIDENAAPVEIVGVVSARASSTSRDMAIYYPASRVADGLRANARFRVPRVRVLTTVELDINAVRPDYFALMALPRLTGGPAGPETGGCHFAVVDRLAAEQHFAGNAPGAALIDATGQRTTISGVVESSHLRHWQRPSLPAVYFPIEDEPATRMSLAVFPAESATVDLEVLHDGVERVPNGFGGVQVATLKDRLSRSALAPEHISSLVMIWLAVATVTLAAIGLHGAILETVRQRRDEVALRLALGARPRQLMMELGRSTFQRACIGAALGGVLAILPALSLEGALGGGVAPTVSIWLTGVSVPVAIVAVAGALPVHNGVRTDLTKLLRRV